MTQMTCSHYQDGRAVLGMDIGLEVGSMFGPLQKSFLINGPKLVHASVYTAYLVRGIITGT